jgi:3D (Asp-Asp-Asp) domain-containing protein
MNQAESPCSVPRIVPALCFTAIFQFVACAQAISDNTAPKAEQEQASQAAEPSAAKFLENSRFDFSALSASLLCSSKLFFDAFAEAPAQGTPSNNTVVIREPKVQIPHPPVSVTIRPNEQKLGQARFAEPETHSKHAPKAFNASAYALRGRTRSGVQTQPGVIAADPRVLPLGTVVQVQAGKYSGVYTVHDTGGAIKGNRVDVWLPSVKEARRFGRRNVKLVVLRYPGQNKPSAASKKPR